MMENRAQSNWLKCRANIFWGFVFFLERAGAMMSWHARCTNCCSTSDSLHRGVGGVWLDFKVTKSKAEPLWKDGSEERVATTPLTQITKDQTVCRRRPFTHLTVRICASCWRIPHWTQEVTALTVVYTLLAGLKRNVWFA